VQSGHGRFARRAPFRFLAMVGEVGAYLIAKCSLMNAKYEQQIPDTLQSAARIGVVFVVS